MTENVEPIDELNRLIFIITDAKKGYQKAAEQIDDPSLKGLLMSLTEQRDNFRKSIREEIHDLGGTPQVASSDLGPVQQAFSQPDLLLILNTVDQTLEKCLRSELKTLSRYKEVFCEARESTCHLIDGQQESVKLAISDLKMMRSSADMAV